MPRRRSHLRSLLLLPFIAAPCVSPLFAQELTPRTYTNVPVGVNYVAIGYGYTIGDRLLDPAIPIDDLDVRSNFLLARYTRSFGLLGRNAKVKAAVPFAFADWSGTAEGAAEERSTDGFGDLLLTFEWNLIGAPAQTREQFRGTRQGRVIGLGVHLVVPVGEHESDRFLNLGSNRYVLKPQVGVSQPLGRWSIEGVLGVTFFGDNDDFLDGSRLEQRAFLELQGHAVYSVRPGFWVSAGLGYGEGAELVVDGVFRRSEIENWRIGASLAYPIGATSGLVLSLFSTARARYGDRLDGGFLAYQFSWGGA